MRRLQRAISCVSPAVIGSVPGALNTYDVSLRGQGPRDRYTRLPGGNALGFAVSYVVIQEPGECTWTATVSTYRYGLYDRDGREILSYHWHPDARSHVTTPHLHLGAASRPGDPMLPKRTYQQAR